MTDATHSSADRPPEVQRALAVRLFNRTWELLDSERDAAGDREVLATAMASRLLWQGVGTDENLAAGDWLVSHVASRIGHGHLALDFAADARSVLEAVDDDEDREIVEGQLATVPGLAQP